MDCPSDNDNDSDSLLSITTSSSLEPVPLELDFSGPAPTNPHVPTLRTDRHRSVAERNARDLAEIQSLFSRPAMPLPFTPSLILIDSDDEENLEAILKCRSAQNTRSPSSLVTQGDTTLANTAPNIDPAQTPFRPVIAAPPRFRLTKKNTIPSRERVAARIEKWRKENPAKKPAKSQRGDSLVGIRRPEAETASDAASSKGSKGHSSKELDLSLD